MILRILALCLATTGCSHKDPARSVTAHVPALIAPLPSPITKADTPRDTVTLVQKLERLDSNELLALKRTTDREIVNTIAMLDANARAHLSALIELGRRAREVDYRLTTESIKALEDYLNTLGCCETSTPP